MKIDYGRTYSLDGTFPTLGFTVALSVICSEEIDLILLILSGGHHSTMRSMLHLTPSSSKSEIGFANRCKKSRSSSLRMKNKLVTYPLKRAAKEKNETNSEEAQGYFMGTDP